MASLIERKIENITGRFYVDRTCIGCGLCREIAPNFFLLDDDSGQSIVQQQPTSPDEVALAEEALTACPTNSIGDDGAG